ncbi:hypothetical protein AC792_01400 [Arthrobacter sp. RIT-PI-e]|uniref:ArsR/SmtB family transcription factor n=1 Tax=Arthrobacter sp. RIT-PI-e TaxID=1681197 RepID=UPI000675E144|nr:metalloregulator ArsR/SmtB family transcription factor [Arthrobacter sp. RIT-PI-e]KNC20304.1 hypothetical protein AC792_01400 [Arthrobacter sp. RIT-PI-e]
MAPDDVFAVIAEGTRRQILENLRGGDKAVGELVLELGVSQPTVSKHLKVLREAGLVMMRAQGQKRFYSLEAGPLGVIQGWLSGFDGPVPAAELPFDAAGPPGQPEGGVDDVVVDQEAVPARAGQTQEILAPAVLMEPEPLTAIDIPRPPIGRTMGRAAERAADLLAHLRRRKDA